LQSLGCGLCRTTLCPRVGGYRDPPSFRPVRRSHVRIRSRSHQHLRHRRCSWHLEVDAHLEVDPLIHLSGVARFGRTAPLE
jgi:hypothetical protein